MLRSRKLLSKRFLLLRLQPALLLCLTLLWGTEAFAQFTNHGIGFSAGYLTIDRSVGASSGPVLGLESTLYIENGFDLYFRAMAGIHKDLVSDKNAVGLFPAVGVRYLLSEEQLRPYVGLSFAYMHFFGSDNLPGALFALSPFLGLDYYFQSNTAFGLQGEYQRILVLNGDGGNAYALLAHLSWGF